MLLLLLLLLLGPHICRLWSTGFALFPYARPVVLPTLLPTLLLPPLLLWPATGVGSASACGALQVQPVLTHKVCECVCVCVFAKWGKQVEILLHSANGSGCALVVLLYARGWSNLWSRVKIKSNTHKHSREFLCPGLVCLEKWKWKWKRRRSQPGPVMFACRWPRPDRSQHSAPLAQSRTHSDCSPPSPWPTLTRSLQAGQASLASSYFLPTAHARAKRRAKRPASWLLAI